MLKSDRFQSTTEIDARLAQLEQEKKQLLALREQLQQPLPNTSDSTLYSPEQKIAILEGCLEAETIFLQTTGKTNKVAVVTLLPAIMSGYKASVTSRASNVRIAITVSSLS